MMMTPNITFTFTTATLSPLITFTRSLGTATRVNSSGYVETVAADVARFDYSPISLICRGLLIEGTSQNLFLQSEDVSNAFWQLANVNLTIVADSVTSPANLLNADNVIPTAVAGQHYLQTSQISNTAGQQYTVSVFAKATGYNFLRVGPANTTSSERACFDLSNGTFIESVSGSSKIENYGNGWYRCSVTYTALATTTASHFFSVNNASSLNTLTFTGDGTSGLSLWGAQFETGTQATSYIPTTTAAVTRNADVATITGTNFTNWWQSGYGGVTVQARPGMVSGVRPWIQFDDGTANEIIAVRGNGTDPELYIVDGGVVQAQIDAGTIAANTDYSFTGWWAVNDCRARLNSGSVVTDTSATIPTVTQARLGSDGTNYLNGHLASVSYYNSFSDRIYTRRKNKAVFSLF